MSQLQVVSYFFAGFFGGMGIFFLGIAALWFVSVYKEKEK